MKIYLYSEKRNFLQEETLLSSQEEACYMGLVMNYSNYSLFLVNILEIIQRKRHNPEATKNGMKLFPVTSRNVCRLE